MNFRLIKKLLSILIILITVSVASAQKKAEPVIISGKLGETATYKQIYLDTLNGQNPWIFAYSEIDSLGNFKMVADVKTVDIYRLRLDNENYMMLILEPGEKVTISTPSSQLGIPAIVSGSPQTQLLYKAVNIQQTYDAKNGIIDQQYKQAQNSASKDSLSSILISQFNQNDADFKSEIRSLMQSQPASIAWLFFLYLNNQPKFDINTDFEIVTKVEAAMYKAYPENDFVKQYHDKIELEKVTAIGSLAPDIELPDAEGKMRKLSSLKGKVVLIDFWASWCGPCRKENPNVVAVYNKYHSKGFEIFSVSLDKDRESWLKAIAKDNLLWPDHVSDLKYWKSEGAKIYGVTSIPYTVLIDKKGKIVAKRLRGEELEQKVKELCE